MSYYEVISQSYRFGRVYDHLIEKHMPEDIKKLVDYLSKEHGLALDGIYLENYKAPDRVVVMKGKLPIEALRAKFPEGNGLRYSETTVISDKTFSSLEGSE
jgi:hypothetical protein